MNARKVIATALVAAAGISTSANAATWARIGDKSDSVANTSASMTITGAKLRGAKWLQINATGVAQVTHKGTDVNGRSYVAWVETDAVPDISGSYSLSCSNSDSFNFRSGSFSNDGRTVKVPVSNPTKCNLYLSVTASVDTTYPSESDWVIVRATAQSRR